MFSSLELSCGPAMCQCQKGVSSSGQPGSANTSSVCKEWSEKANKMGNKAELETVANFAVQNWSVPENKLFCKIKNHRDEGSLARN